MLKEKIIYLKHFIQQKKIQNQLKINFLQHTLEIQESTLSELKKNISEQKDILEKRKPLLRSIRNFLLVLPFSLCADKNLKQTTCDLYMDFTKAISERNRFLPGFLRIIMNANEEPYKKTPVFGV